MSKKRTSSESNNDEQTNEDSESQLQEEDSGAKRAKLNSLSDTTLGDLPIELFECILVKVVTKEVWELKLAKSVWKEKADVVLSRLEAVCPHWSSILTSSLFRNELHRVLDGTAQEIRLNISTGSSNQSGETRAVALLEGEVFILYRRNDRDCVCNGSYGNNVSDTFIEDIVPLRETDVVCMAACDVSNSIYVGLRNKNGHDPSVLRISRDEDHQFYMTLKYHKLPISTMSVSAKMNGNLIILSVQEGQDPGVVSIYDANGSLQKEIILSPDIDAHRYKNAIQKSNGNLVLACVNDQNLKMKLLEIDTNGSVVREYQSSFSLESFVSFAGRPIYDRIMIADPILGIELLDSEFNVLNIYSLEQDKGKDLSISDLHYDNYLNKIVRVHFDRNSQTGGLTFFRFTEE